MREGKRKNVPIRNESNVGGTTLYRRRAPRQTCSEGKKKRERPVYPLPRALSEGLEMRGRKGTKGEGITKRQNKESKSISKHIFKEGFL